jgi:iron(III) transport system ATP-binding protein
MDHGRLAQVAAPRDLYREPANEMVASFIAQGIVLPAKVLTAEESGHCRVEVLGQELVARCRAGERPRENASICCRADDIQYAEPRGDGISGTVRRAVYKGGAARIDFAPAARPDLELHFDQPDPVTFEAGQTASIRIATGWVIPGASA